MKGNVAIRPISAKLHRLSDIPVIECD